METRKGFMKAFVWSILLYGCETWTIQKYERDRLEAFEMWIWRRMTRTSWVERKSNEEVLQSVEERRELISHILKRKAKLIGHSIRHSTFLSNIFEGKILGRRTRGRPRTSYFKDVKRLMDVSSYSHLKRVATDRDKWLIQQGAAFRR